MESHETGRQFGKTVLELGKPEDDINGFNIYKNEKRMAKSGFSAENFQDIFNDTNLNGRLVYELVWFSVDYHRRCAIDKINERHERAEEFKKLKEHALYLLGGYMLFGDYKEYFVKKEKMTSASMNLLMGFKKKVEL